VPDEPIKQRNPILEKAQTLTTKTSPEPTPVATPTETELGQVEASPTPLAWFTLEGLLYVVILVLALALRVWHLGAIPLSNTEAEQSLVALSLYHGNLPQSSQYSPLLASLNSLSFLLFGTSDASARLASALLGTALVLLPFSLRRQLGGLTCLLTSALLALSPVAIFLSRTINSEIAVAVGALSLVAGFYNWAEDGQQRWLLLMAGGLALLLTAGPMAYSVILVFGLIVLYRFSLFKAMWARGLSNSAASYPRPEEKSNDSMPFLSRDGASQPPTPEGTETTTYTVPSNLRNAGAFLLIAVFLLATAATLNIGGFGVATTLFVDWLSRIGLRTSAEAGFNAIFMLTIYEPLLVVAGLIGLAYTIVRNNNIPERMFVGWFLGLLLLDLLMGGRPNSNVILPLVPLAFLAAIALAKLWTAVQQWGTWSNEGILLGTGLVIFGFAYIGLTGWILRTCSPDDRICQLSWLQPIAALMLLFIVAVFFAYMGGIGATLRGLALSWVVVGILAMVSIGWRLNYGPLMHLAYQPLAGIPVSTELVKLTETLADQSMARVDDASLLDVTLIGIDSPALRWRLREYRHLAQANSFFEATPTTAIITPANPDQELEADETYLGQDFDLDAIWSPVGLPPRGLVEWLIYRQSGERPQGNKAVLWLRLDES
jgi:uncharacterized protein (TIGR03663 family)